MITTGIVVSFDGDPKKDTVTYILQIGGRGQGKGEWRVRGGEVGDNGQELNTLDMH